jgi:hypothetical protein
MPALSQQQIDFLNKAYGETWRNPPNPSGLYRQAPPEHGGNWWRVDPFTGPTPWDRTPPAEKPLPPGFEDAFGKRPSEPTALVRWLQDLEYFKGVGVPGWTDADAVNAANHDFVAWGMGNGRFYDGRYGWMVRFPDSRIPTYENSAWAVLNTPHLVIAHYQTRLIEMGERPSPLHPFVPPFLVGGENPPK